MDIAFRLALVLAFTAIGLAMALWSHHYWRYFEKKMPDFPFIRMYRSKPFLFAYRLLGAFGAAIGAFLFVAILMGWVSSP